LKEWAKDFPDGMLVDFAELLMKHHSNLPDDHRDPEFRMEYYLVTEND
jgi:hypothetical protein